MAQIEIYDSDYNRLNRLSELMDVDVDIIVNEILDNWFDEYRKLAGITEEEMEEY